MVLNNNKSQLLILSVLVLLTLLIFSYSQETQNNYIKENSNIDIVENVIFETCNIGKLSNGTYIEQRYSNYSSDINSYCQRFNYSCILNITNTDGETNLSILNYNNFSYNLKFNSSNKYLLNKNFTC